MSHPHTNPQLRSARHLQSLPHSMGSKSKEKKRYLGNPGRMQSKSASTACWQILLSFAVIFMYFYFTSTPANQCQMHDSKCPNQHFTKSYDRARQRFLNMSSKIAESNAYRLPAAGHGTRHNLSTDAETLYTDITIVNEHSTKSNHLILHISGIAGIDGYVGSAVQSDILSRISNYDTPISNADPVIVFVHALNPQAMYYALNSDQYVDTENEVLRAFLNPTYNMQHVMEMTNKWIPGARFFKLNWVIHYAWSYLVDWYCKTQFYAHYLTHYDKEFAVTFHQYLENVGLRRHEREWLGLVNFLRTKFQEHHWGTQLSKISLATIHYEWDSGDHCNSNANAAQQYLNRIGDDLQLPTSIDRQGVTQRVTLLPQQYVVNAMRFHHSYHKEYINYCDTMDTHNPQQQEIAQLMRFATSYSSDIMRKAFCNENVNWRKTIIWDGYRKFAALLEP